MQQGIKILNEALTTVIASKIAFYLPGFFAGFLLRICAPWIWLRILLELPGTIAHELSHFLVAIVLNAKPAGFSIIPHKSPSGWVLGSVTLANTRWYNALFCGLAPLLMFLAFYPWVPSYWAVLPPSMENLKLWALMAIFLPSAIPSSTDIKVGLVATILPIILFVFICYWASKHA